jgi:hypothetical protein
MATITAQDAGAWRRALYQGDAKDLIKRWPNLPDESTSIAAMQVIEDQITAAAVTIRNQIETLIGHTLGYTRAGDPRTAAQARTDMLEALIVAYMRWRLGEG